MLEGRGRGSQPRILYPAKIPFKNPETKTSSDKQNLRDHCRKRVLQADRKCEWEQGKEGAREGRSRMRGHYPTGPCRPLPTVETTAWSSRVRQNTDKDDPESPTVLRGLFAPFLPMLTFSLQYVVLWLHVLKEVFYMCLDFSITES